MQKVANFLVFLHDEGELSRKVLGVRRHEAQAELALDPGAAVQKLGEGHPPVPVAVVGIDILPQEGDLLIPLTDEAFDFFQNDLGPAGALSASHIGHDAIGAEVVAPVGDVHPGVGIARADGGDVVLRLLALGKDGDLLFALFAQGIDERAELRHVVRAEDNVDKGKFLP